MTQLLKLLPLVVTLVALPAFAAGPDVPAGRHPPAAAETAKPAAPPANTADKPATHACAMMDGKAMAGSGATASKGPDGKTMMAGKDMPCRPAPAAAKGADAPHDHDAAPR